MKLLALPTAGSAGFPGNDSLFNIVPLDPAHRAGLAGHPPVKNHATSFDDCKRNTPNLTHSSGIIQMILRSHLTFVVSFLIRNRKILLPLRIGMPIYPIPNGPSLSSIRLASTLKSDIIPKKQIFFSEGSNHDESFFCSAWSS
jgi:hypothetical protein